MWPRYLELILGLWLIASPWVLPHPEPPFRFLNEVVSGFAIVVLSIASFFRPTRWAHLVTGAVALWVGAAAYFFEPRPGPPGAQNDITVAFLLLMLCILPNEASQAPRPWRQHGNRR
jgi:hypothetical protein